MSIEKQANPQIKKLSAYVPGKAFKDIQKKYHFKKKDILKLSSNENMLGPSPKAKQALQNEVRSLNLYPDGGGIKLKEQISKEWKIRPNQVVLGNGSNEILELACRAFISKGDEVLVSKNTFSMYEAFSLISGAKVKKIPLKNYTYDLKGFLKNISAKTKMIFICNPNNPTGTVISHKELAEFIKKVKKSVLIVLDEAYGDFRHDNGFKQSVSFTKNENVLLLRTFSKIFGLAALRIGYGLAHPKLADILNRVRQPFNVNAMAQAAALAGLEDKAHKSKSQWLIWEERKFLQDEIRAFGCDVLPSEANFICVKVGNAQKIAEKMEKEGVLIRPLNSFGMKDFVRISIGTRIHNERMLKAFAKAIQS